MKAKTVEERVAELVAAAPPITVEQREAVVRIMGPKLRESMSKHECKPSKIVRDGEAFDGCPSCSAPPLGPEDVAKIRALLDLRRKDKPAGSSAGFTPPPPPPSPKTALYRHFDAEGVLLYIGITGNLRTRTKDHLRDAVWPDFASRSEAEWFDTREDALTAETLAIREEMPLFNGTGPNRHEIERRRVEYLVSRGRLDLLMAVARR